MGVAGGGISTFQDIFDGSLQFGKKKIKIAVTHIKGGHFSRIQTLVVREQLTYTWFSVPWS